MKKIKKKLPKRLFIEKLQLDNYKSFKEGAVVKLAPMVNLIFGKNSAGKSSIFQALRLFRQSYAAGNINSLNYESPPEYKGKGGFDIDIGYKGIINEGNERKKLNLGIDVGTYSQEKSKISHAGSINFSYKYIDKFYKGENLIQNKTIPSSVSFTNSKDSITIDFPKHKFFKETDQKFESLLREAPNLSFFSRRYNIRGPEKSAYGSIYDPFYFTTKINVKKTELSSIREVYKIYKNCNEKKLTDFIKTLIFNFSLIQKNKKSKGDIPDYNNKKLREISRKLSRELYSNNLSVEERLNWLMKNQDVAEVFYSTLFGYQEDNKLFKEIISDLKSMNGFLKNRSMPESNFYNYFMKDIAYKTKNLIFFRNKFYKDPSKMKDKYFNYFNDTEDSSQFSVNILANILIRTDRPFQRNHNFVNFIGIYDSANVRTSTDDAMYPVDTAMKKMIIVPGLRSMPKRYFVKGMQTNYVGAQAENLAELLANPKIKKTVNEWLKKLEIPYNVGISSSGNYYEIVFKPEKSNFSVAQTHIGLGYPLILPFIVQCLISRNKIIVVEEPEVHLHPKIEADLAELVTYSSKNYSNQFIIETHSEEFLLRLLKNIRINKIIPSDVSINYITNDRKKSYGSIANKILVNKYGQYTTPWKDDLFAERRINYSKK